MSKILYKCENRHDVIFIQKKLFSIGVYWISGIRNVDPFISSNIVYPVYMCNSDGTISWFEGDEIGVLNKFYKKYKIIETNIAKRKDKLLKLNVLCK